MASPEVIDRVIETVRVETNVQERTVEVPVVKSPRSAREWVGVLDRLEWALRTNRMDLDDLSQIDPSLSRVLLAFTDRNDKLHRRGRK